MPDIPLDVTTTATTTATTTTTSGTIYILETSYHHIYGIMIMYVQIMLTLLLSWIIVLGTLQQLQQQQQQQSLTTQSNSLETLLTIMLKQCIEVRITDEKMKIFIKVWKFLNDAIYMLQPDHLIAVRKILHHVGLYDATDLHDCTVLSKLIPLLLPYFKVHPRCYLLKCLN
jgi:hypothetical protein